MKRFITILISLSIILCLQSITNKTASAANIDFRRADANGDEFVDISDADYSFNYLFKGGPPPGSFDAADSNDDGQINLTDGVYTLNYLFLGGDPPPAPGPDTPGPDLTPDGLTSDTYPSNSRSTGSTYSFLGPSFVESEAGTTLQIPIDVILTPDDPVGAWSVGVDVSGTAIIESATIQGTVGALISDTPPGLVDTGFEWTELVGTTGAVSSVELSIIKNITLSTGTDYTILKLILEGQVPDAGLSDFWTLAFSDSLIGSGQEVENIVSVAGLSYVPYLTDLTIEVRGAISTPEPFTTTMLLLAGGYVGLLGWRRRD